jgi:hypothetical protein
MISDIGRHAARATCQPYDFGKFGSDPPIACDAVRRERIKIKKKTCETQCPLRFLTQRQPKKTEQIDIGRYAQLALDQKESHQSPKFASMWMERGTRHDLDDVMKFANFVSIGWQDFVLRGAENRLFLH